jgi:CBS domain-containing protein
MHFLRDIMSRDVEVVSPDTYLSEISRRMHKQDVGAIPVCDGKKIKGFITDRDIVTRSIAVGRDPNSTTARDVMTSSVVYCFEDQTVEDAAQLMRDHQVRRLMVLDRNKNLVGIVSIGDLATGPLKDNLIAKTLHGVSSGNGFLSGWKGFQRDYGKGVGLFALSSSVVALGYFLVTRNRSVIQEQFDKAKSFNRNQASDFLKAS